MRGRWTALSAAAAAVAAVALLGGPGTQAQWSNTASSGTTRIQAGTLTGTVAQTGPTTYSVGSGSNVYVAQPPTAAGIIPGVQGQSWTYTLTNTSASAVPASARLELKSSSVSGDYAALRPYLQATVAVDGAAPTTVPATAFTDTGFTHTVNLPGALQPGQGRTVVVRVFVPMTTAGGIDVPQQLRSLRSAAATTPVTVLTMANSLGLTQVPETR